MTDAERNHIAQHVWQLLTDVRAGRATLVEERVAHIAWLLDHPGWQVNRPINFEEATHDRF